MPTTLFSSLEEKDKNTAVEKIIEQSTPRHDFFLMMTLSVLMATFGLLLNNVAVIIGSMLIAPILSPLMSVSLGVTMADSKLIWRSTFTILKSLIIVIPAAAVVTLLFLTFAEIGIDYNTEIISRTEPSVIFAAIALVAGLAASFAMIKPQLNEALPGVAISVALIPPLAVTGIGLAFLNWTIISRSFVVFLINAVMIVFASLIIFSLMRMYSKRPIADKVVREEDAKLEQEKAKEENK
ncbi:MAG: TIGR00341 family protein [Candidatus Uhrbacteria bacterium]